MRSCAIEQHGNVSFKPKPKPGFFEKAKIVAGITAAEVSVVAPKAMSSSVAVTAVLYTTGVLAASVCLPVCVGMIIGLLPPTMIAKYLKNRSSYNDIFDDRPRAGMMFSFLLAASTQLLGMLIGLAITSMVVTLAMNPFTTSALIAGGVSAGIILGLYMYLNYKINQAYRIYGNQSVSYRRDIYEGDSESITYHPHMAIGSSNNNNGLYIPASSLNDDHTSSSYSHRPGISGYDSN